jgi:hypothetical protein
MYYNQKSTYTRCLAVTDTIPAYFQAGRAIGEVGLFVEFAGFIGFVGGCEVIVLYPSGVLHLLVGGIADAEGWAASEVIHRRWQFAPPKVG